MRKILLVMLLIILGIADAAVVTDFNSGSTLDFIFTESNHDFSYSITLPKGYVYDARMTLEGIDVSGQEILPAEIMIVTDTSGSMDDDCPGGSANPGETPCKINDAKNAALALIDYVALTAIRVGLVEYDTCPNPFLDLLPLTNVYDDLTYEINNYYADGYTNIGGGIKLAIDELDTSSRSGAGKYLIMMTDGQANRALNTDGNCISPGTSASKQYARDMAQLARDHGIVVYGIAFGSDADTSLVRDIADSPDHYFFAPDADELQSIYSEIAEEIFWQEFPRPVISSTDPLDIIGWRHDSKYGGVSTWQNEICEPGVCIDYRQFLQENLYDCGSNPCTIDFNVHSDAPGELILSDLNIQTLDTTPNLLNEEYVLTCSGEGTLWNFKVDNIFDNYDIGFYAKDEELLIFTKNAWPSGTTLFVNSVEVVPQFVSNLGMGRLYRIDTEPNDHIFIENVVPREVMAFISQDPFEPAFNISMGYGEVHNTVSTVLYMPPTIGMDFVLFDKFSVWDNGQPDTRRVTVSIDGIAAAPSGPFPVDIFDKSYTQPYPEGTEGIILDEFNVFDDGYYRFTVNTQDSIFWLLFNCPEERFDECTSVLDPGCGTLVTKNDAVQFDSNDITYDYDLKNLIEAYYVYSGDGDLSFDLPSSTCFDFSGIDSNDNVILTPTDPLSDCTEILRVEVEDSVYPELGTHTAFLTVLYNHVVAPACTRITDPGCGILSVQDDIITFTKSDSELNYDLKNLIENYYVYSDDGILAFNLPASLCFDITGPDIDNKVNIQAKNPDASCTEQLNVLVYDLVYTPELGIHTAQLTIGYYSGASGCGDGVINPGEQCEPADWGPISGCEDFDEFTGGNLECLDCFFDTSGCTGGVSGNCGDGIVNPGETCDGTNLDGKSCRSFNDFTDGALSCVNCQLDTSGCSMGECGDNKVQPGETCDGTDWGTITSCEDFDEFTGGVLECHGCLFDTSKCTGGTPYDCGNGIVDTGETCDGTNLDGKRCSDFDEFGGGFLKCDNCNINTSGCSDSLCGDGITDPGEECDDGCPFVVPGVCVPQDNLDSCTQFCLDGYCGDDYWQLDLDEDCDDGNSVNGDGCSNCMLDYPEACGDNTMDPGEECDDGNNIAGDGCSATCQLENPFACGNGDLDPGEECDDSNNDFNDGCGPTCQWEECGDWIIQLGEECDDGGVLSGDGCSGACLNEYCGDGMTQPLAGEQCDDGNTLPLDGCDSDCLLENLTLCGDSDLDPGEECDDGNHANNDGCTATCQLEFCGDAILQIGEQCDFGDTNPGDGCDENCQLENPLDCGNWIIDPGEQCDDGNNDNEDHCNQYCQLEFCGDNIKQIGIGEECDDGNLINGDGCTTSCFVDGEADYIKCRMDPPKYIIHNGEELYLAVDDYFDLDGFAIESIYDPEPDISVSVDGDNFRITTTGFKNARALGVTVFTMIGQRTCILPLYSIESKCDRMSCNACFSSSDIFDCLVLTNCVDGVLKVYNPNTPISGNDFVNGQSLVIPPGSEVDEFISLDPGFEIVPAGSYPMNTDFYVSGPTLENGYLDGSVLTINAEGYENNPLRVCPALLRMDYTPGVSTYDVGSGFQVTGSRSVTGYYEISGRLRSEGPYIFTAKVWLR